MHILKLITLIKKSFLLKKKCMRHFIPDYNLISRVFLVKKIVK